MLTFIHTSDLHLDTPFSGLSKKNPEIKEKLVNAGFEAYDSIIELCITKKVDFLLISGDIYDGEEKSLKAQLKFIKGLKRLSDAGIYTYIVHGNHDPLKGWSSRLKWPENAFVFGGESVQQVYFMKNKKPAAKILGISFMTNNISENLVLQFPEKQSDPIFTIGMLHCTLNSSVGHDFYAPCSEADLVSKGYDYWALGHIHKPQLVREAEPAIVYPGIPQGRDAGESGPHGCYYVQAYEEGDIVAQFIETDSVRWHIEETNVSGLATEDELTALLSSRIDVIREEMSEKPVIFRFVLTGRTPLHSLLSFSDTIDQIIEYLQESELFSSSFFMIESIKNHTKPILKRENLLEKNCILGDIIKICKSIRSDPEKMDEIKTALDPLTRHSVARNIITEIDDEELKTLINEAEDLLINKLLPEGLDES